MAGVGDSIRTVLLKGVEAVGKVGASLGANAQQKLNEMSFDARLTELRKQIPVVAKELWKDGVELPEKLTVLVSELSELEEKVAAMRPKPEAKEPEETPKTSEEASAPETCEIKDGLEKVVQCAGEALGTAMDAVGSFVESAVEKVGEAVASMKESASEEKTEEACEGEPADEDAPAQETASQEPAEEAEPEEETPEQEN